MAQAGQIACESRCRESVLVPSRKNVGHSGRAAQMGLDKCHGLYEEPVVGPLWEQAGEGGYAAQVHS